MTVNLRDLLFLIRKSDMWLDGWTYGDWRQYISRRADGALQPCRISNIPAFLMLLGVFCLFPVITALIMVLAGAAGDIYWERLIVVTTVGMLMLGTGGFLSTGPWRLVTAVGPRSYDGYRHF